MFQSEKPSEPLPTPDQLPLSYVPKSSESASLPVDVKLASE